MFCQNSFLLTDCGIYDISEVNNFDIFLDKNCTVNNSS